MATVEAEPSVLPPPSSAQDFGTTELHVIERQRREGHSFNSTQITGQARVQLGDSYVGQQLLTMNIGSNSSVPAAAPPDPNHGFRFIKPVGLCLDQAPHIDTSFFVGRESELTEMHQILHPGHNNQQRRLVLGGMGGVGKTQLAIAYAKRHSDLYNSVFWLNASSEATMATSIQAMAEQIFGVQVKNQVTDSSQILIHTKRWLSSTRNTGWMLILDNHDEPESFNIQNYYPHTSHGAIIVTTRLPDRISGSVLHVHQLDDINHGLKILETRSQRMNLKADPFARRLVRRLQGLPLALATAGAHLRKSTWSFEKYLEEYETRWNIHPRRPVKLSDYRDRTFCTTWDLSYMRLESEDPTAAQVLKLLAYFDHQTIWYDLIRGANNENLPVELSEVIHYSHEFDGVMQTLADYCFIELRCTDQRYSMHACVHDWTLANLNSTVDDAHYWYAFDCVVAFMDSKGGEYYSEVRYREILPHAIRLTHAAFDHIGRQLTELRVDSARELAELVRSQGDLATAALLLQRTLSSQESLPDFDSNASALRTLGNLGRIYADQRKATEAEEMLTRSLDGLEMTVGMHHGWTLETMRALAWLYIHQWRFGEAEQLFMEVLHRCQQFLEPNSAVIAEGYANLGDAYLYQGNYEDAELMFRQSLNQMEDSKQHEHLATYLAARRLGILFSSQGKLEEAEKMLQRAYNGLEKILGAENWDTLFCAVRLSIAYSDQGNIQASKLICEQSLLDTETLMQRSTSQPVRSSLTAIFHHGMQLCLPHSSEFQRYMTRQVQLVKWWQYEDTDVFYWLAKGLFCVDDVEGAEVAFQQMISASKGSPFEQSLAFCSGCGGGLSVNFGFHVCKQCHEIDFCNKCLSTYPHPKVVGCKNHTFLNAGTAIAKASGKVKTRSESEIWLNDIIAKYGLDLAEDND